MPALIFLRRRWRLGSDDLVFPGIFEIAIRISCLVLAVVLVAEHLSESDDTPSCHKGGLLLQIYIYGFLIILGLNLLTAMLLVYHSARGSIMSTYPRRYVPKILVVRLCFGLLEVGWNILGTVFVFSDHIQCNTDTTLWMLIKAQIIFTWSATTVIVISAYALFEPMMRPNRQEFHQSFRNRSILDRNSGPGTYYVQKWEKRCRILCCTFSKDEDSTEAFKNVADVFASLFEQSHLVPSDIAAALVLLRLKRKQEEAKEDQRQIFQGLIVHPAASDSASSTSAITQQSSEGPPDWMTVSNAYHFMKFALGSYGWPWFVYGRFLTGCFALQKYLQCCSCLRTTSIEGERDNCCMCNIAALKAVTNLTEENIIYVSFQNKIYETPFFVAIDDDTKHIIISIRGTLSLQDAITDLNAQSVSLTSDGLPSGCLAHQGMIRSAHFVKNKLDEFNLLQIAFDRHPDYELAITGHSLGAGTAVLLAAMLKSKYPTIKCFAFSPPGGLCSPELLETTKNYVFSIIVGNDLVPRLSIAAVRDMHSNILTVLRECKKSKYRVLASGCWYMCCGISKSSLENASTPDSSGSQSQEDLLASDIASVSISSYESVQSTGPQHRVHRRGHLPLYLPGRILHITPRVPHSKENPFVVSWSEAKNFEKIIISPNMMRHHLPHNVLSILQCLHNSGQ